nr:hypothetical protein BaRGS_004761 [Batillaria attramentaria]
MTDLKMALTAKTKPITDVLLEDIKTHATTEIFRRHLEKCSRLKVESWKDADGLDLLHHAILENNFVVVGTFFAQGYFKPPHEVTTSWSYVHLAATLGHRTIVSMLLQERPFDNKKLQLEWELFYRVINPKVDISKTGGARVPLEEKDKESAMLPLDLAARFGHLMCVKTILDFHIYSTRGPPTVQRSTKDNYLNMSCKLDSPLALRLLLSETADNIEDAKTALDISLKMAKPECVDALLRFGIDCKRLFGGMNLFHVLFAYSKSFEESWFESVVSVTSVLLRHGHDVNACRPSRTFPLYSLLRCTRISSMEKSAPYIMASLLLLLQASANPNFDEVFVEEAVRDKEHNTAFGRHAYPSALHCVMDAAVHYAEEVSDRESVPKYVYKCCELLLRHGADASYVGKYSDTRDVTRRGNALHALADAASHIGRIDRTILLLLMRHGADPDECADGRYPLTAFCDDINDPTPTSPRRQRQREELEDHDDGTGGTEARTGTRTETVTPAARPPAQRRISSSVDSDFVIDVKRMCRIIGFMSHRAQVDCEKILRKKLHSVTARAGSSSESNGVTGLRVVVKELEEHTQTVKSLKRCLCFLGVATQSGLDWIASHD